jgi:hypothetical protein
MCGAEKRRTLAFTNHMVAMSMCGPATHAQTSFVPGHSSNNKVVPVWTGGNPSASLRKTESGADMFRECPSDGRVIQVDNDFGSALHLEIPWDESCTCDILHAGDSTGLCQ